MKKLVYSILILLVAIAFRPDLSGQEFLKASGKAIVNESGDTVIIRAMGLGGWMLQEGYMLQTGGFASAQFQIRNKIEELIGKEDTDLFYQKWLENHMQKTDVDSLASWGFNAVRLPMHYNLFTLPIEDEPIAGQHTWLNKGFELTDSLVSWCKENNMYVLLDLHAAPGGQGYESGISDYDPTKPSLWESKANRDKTVALWKRIADHYKDEPAIMGYDLINETNWNMNNGAPLRQLFMEITDSIRQVDNKHIIMIEGNWFANDFTGLTPPWDDNLVYGPHKYWSKNENEDIQWVLTIRDNYNVPIFFGESGENSNTWFKEAISLFENNGMGWAWWPLKKVESISCPLSIVKTPEYQQLLDYWNGNGPQPSAAFAKATLMELAENLKTENCIYQKDVIDAMFRQVSESGTIPYNTQNIPGIVYASDFSLGANQEAYFDTDVADYHLNTGSYTPWNSGWAYRNDGVDIEFIDDNFNSNGVAVGWIALDEWMKYDIKVEEDALYDVNVRIASNSSGGKFYFGSKGARISKDKILPSTGGWYNWKNYTLSDVVLTTQDKSIEFHVSSEGFNLSSFEFVRKAALSEINTNLLAANTKDKSSVNLIINKPLKEPFNGEISDFKIKVNGGFIPVNNVALAAQNKRLIIVDVDYEFKSTDNIRASYSGDEVEAIDDTNLEVFTDRLVANNIEVYLPVPGKIEAEDYHYQIGIQLENCTDTGGGQNIAYLNPGDYLDYFIDVEKSGTYAVEYRTSAESQVGRVQLQLVHADGSVSELHTANFIPTGGWQNWRSTTENLVLNEGKQKIRMLIMKSDFNINWFDFSFLTNTEAEVFTPSINIYPNPSREQLFVNGSWKEGQLIDLTLMDIYGNKLYSKQINNSAIFHSSIPISNFPEGVYYLKISNSKGKNIIKKIIKTGE